MGEEKKKRERIVRCPNCRKSAHYHESNPWRPFCCERCKTADIAAWANEDYRVDGGPVNPDDFISLSEDE